MWQLLAMWPDNDIWVPLDVSTVHSGDGCDPHAYVVSANIHRRHLTAEQRRELIARVLKADPSKSNREIGRQTKADDKTVAAVRREKEATAEIPQLDKTTGRDGKSRPSALYRKVARKAKFKPPAKAPPDVTELAEAMAEPPPGFREATNLLGIISRFAEFCSTHDPENLARGLMPGERADVREKVRAISQWNGQLLEQLRKAGDAAALKAAADHAVSPQTPSDDADEVPAFIKRGWA
jgi:hypothetical protein